MDLANDDEAEVLPPESYNLPEFEDLTLESLHGPVVIASKPATPDLIFLRSNEVQALFEKLCHDLELAYRSDFYDVRNEQLDKVPDDYSEVFKDKGPFVVVYYKGVFYRGEAVSTSKSGLVNVYLIDEGYEVEIIPKRCFEPQMQFFQDPPMVSRCHLAHISKGPSNEWSPEVLKVFHGQLYQYQKVGLLRRGEELLMSDGSMSFPVDFTFKKTIIENFSAKAMQIMEFFSALLAKEGAIFGGIESPSPEENDPFEDESIESNHFEGRNPVTRWQNPVIPDWKQDEKVHAFVTGTDKLGQVYVSEEQGIFLIEWMTDFAAEAYHDVDELHLSEMTTKKDWIEGEDCMFFHRTGKKWLRAKIIKVCPTGYHLFLVDYGSITEMQDLKTAITWKDLRIPFFFGDIPITHIRVIFNDLVYSGNEPYWPNFAAYVRAKDVLVTPTLMRETFPIHVKMELGDDMAKEKEDLSESFMLFQRGLKKGTWGFQDITQAQDAFDNAAFGVQAVVNEPSIELKIEDFLPPPWLPRTLADDIVSWLERPA